MRTRLRRLLAALAIAGLLSACGDGATLSPEQYATSLCGAASEFMAALEARNSGLQSDLAAAGEDPVAIQDLMVAFLGGAAEDTQALIDDVSALSPPDVERGLDIHEAAISAFKEARDLFTAAQDQIEALDATDEQSFNRALTDLSMTLSQAGTGISESVKGLSNPELDAAFDAAPACAQVPAA
jgi:hypothetical protein